MGVRQMVSRVAAAGLLAAAAVLTPATAAQAAPTGCSAWDSAGVGYATCTGGTGTVWVVIQCLSLAGDEITRLGNAAAVGQLSRATCPSSVYWSLQPEPWYTTSG
ncbi:hypothetical protein KBX35_27450 [Micromonospora sp. C32]|uniref:hypothetical protein n=1 Tax=Micromonospora sp. C32 TaxID=2824877 RepID=UPI001B3945D1|nr:hypothetical protein [Micromonospora sp. C32]MBQ1058528.1 hypothetical protein [Micromonospora sp. C32]